MSRMPLGLGSTFGILTIGTVPGGGAERSSPAPFFSSLASLPEGTAGPGRVDVGLADELDREVRRPLEDDRLHLVQRDPRLDLRPRIRLRAGVRDEDLIREVRDHPTGGEADRGGRHGREDLVGQIDEGRGGRVPGGSRPRGPRRGAR